jgi:hypothetical protein
VKQITANWRAPHGQAYVEILPLFLVTLTRNCKSQEIFKLNSLNHIIKVEPYGAQTGLMQCYNCQNLGHGWATASTPPLDAWWCGGGHLNRECPEKTNTESTPSCCSCTPVEGEKPHPASYRGCSHAKGEQQKREAQRSLKGFSGRMSFSKFTSSGQSYVAALRQDTRQQPQAPQTGGKSVQHPFSSICHNRNSRKQMCQ